jgi:hypothetical protein
MKYFITLFAIAAFASCDTSKNYECQCTNRNGDVLGTYDKKYKKAADGQAECLASQDALAKEDSAAQVRCQFYANY